MDVSLLGCVHTESSASETIMLVQCEILLFTTNRLILYFLPQTFIWADNEFSATETASCWFTKTSDSIVATYT